MKMRSRFVLGISVFVFLGLLPQTSQAQPSGRGTAKATIGGAQVTIDYGRPSLKGRDPLNLIYPGDVWRMGANAPTTIESTQDLIFGGTRVAKGKHILLVRYIEPGKWELIVSTQSAMQYKPDARLAAAPMTLTKGEASTEVMTISLTAKDHEGMIDLAWGTMRLSAPFSVAM
jgi:hypothetical protein